MQVFKGDFLFEHMQNAEFRSVMITPDDTLGVH